MSRLKALYRSWGIPCSGTQVYTPRHREQWLSRIAQPGVRRRAELFYQQLDGLLVVRHTVRGEQHATYTHATLCKEGSS